MTRQPPNRTKAINAAEVQRLASLGLSNVMIAEIMGISISTLQRRIKRDPAIADAIHHGLVTVKTRIRAELVKQAMQGNTRILLRLAEDLGVLSSQGITVKGDKTNPVPVSTTDDKQVITQMTCLITQLESAARSKPDQPASAPE